MDLEKLGERIRERRLSKGLTQSQLANSLYLSPQAVSKWERGENAPDILLLPKLAALLDRSIEWIITGHHAGTDEITATVLSTSMRNFISRNREYRGRKLALWINGILHTVTESVLSGEGVPVKYTGDGLLAYFSGRGHEQRALKAARQICELVSDRNMLITLKAGGLFLGSIGHREYRMPDILGDTVNAVFLYNRQATENGDRQVYFDETVTEAARTLGPLGSVCFEKTQKLYFWKEL
ncbi:MAG: helix-turn-helix domain-containing protein [Fibrobacterota bacterium]